LLSLLPINAPPAAPTASLMIRVGLTPAQLLSIALASSERALEKFSKHYFDNSALVVHIHIMPKKLDLSVMENCVCFNLRWVTRLVTKFFDAEMRRHGIRPTQGTILTSLDAKESWSMAELSDWLGMERTTLVRNLRPLQRDGLVQAVGGGRGNRVELAITSKGRKQIEKLAPAWKSAQSAAVKTLGEKRWSVILSDLETAALALNK
jgi:DNA-binding MarR family transcriptional regulator